MNIKGVLGTYYTPGHHEHQGGAGDLFIPRVPIKAVLVPMNIKAVLGTYYTPGRGVLGAYYTPGLHEHQGVLGTYYTPGHHDLFIPRVPQGGAGPHEHQGGWGPMGNLLYPGSP